MKTKVALGIILLIVAALQSTWVPFWEIKGIMPNLPLILVVFVSLLKGEKYGAIMGMLTGLLMDFDSAKYIGLNMLSMLLVGFFVARTMERFYKANYIIPLTATAIGSLIYYASFLFFAFLARAGIPFWQNLISYAIPATLYNMVLAMLLYVVIYLIFERVLKKNLFD